MTPEQRGRGSKLLQAFAERYRGERPPAHRTVVDHVARIYRVAENEAVPLNPPIRKHFRAELDRGAIEAITKVAQSLFRTATEGNNVAAAIFWMKARAGWREKQELRVSVGQDAAQLTDAELEAIILQGEAEHAIPTIGGPADAGGASRPQVSVSIRTAR